MQQLASYVEVASATLNRIAIVAAASAVLAMVCAAGWQVIARYVLDQPPIWTEELARRAMIWAGLLGATAAFRAKTEPTLFPGAAEIGGGTGLLLATIRAAGVLLLAVPVLWFCFVGPRGGFERSFLDRTANRPAEMLDIPMVWFTAAIPVAFTLILIHLAADLMRRIAHKEVETHT
ncbi:TRAP transporter small permease subunit [Seohaeicola saemankumensis]|uniref:TRAP transporter small permease n=1 Tax=Seohaeicola saemankumensis TaxID=481181 RepID=UPI0035CEC4AE